MDYRLFIIGMGMQTLRMLLMSLPSKKLTETQREAAFAALKVLEELLNKLATPKQAQQLKAMKALKA